MDAPKISLVIPTYNSGPVLERALTSVLSQSYPNLELILADGGSEDESRAICERYRDRFAVFISEPDDGIAHALNRAFRHASGDLYGWLAADDELAPGALQFWADIFGSEDVDVVTGGCRRFFPNGRCVTTTPAANVMERITYHNGIEQPSTLWRADLHKRAGELDTSLKLGFDWDFWCRFQRLGARVKVTERVLSHYHFSAGNLTSQGGRRQMEEMFRIVRTYGPYKGLTAYLYRALYLLFDLHGCYDRPPTAPAWRQAAFHATIAALYRLLPRQVVNGYNWNFASRQERGLVWYE